MKVIFIPLSRGRGHRPIVASSLPVMLTQPRQERSSPEASTISQCYCEIREQDGLLVVQDLGSRHGTFVNGRRVKQSPLRPGDTLSVGANSFLVSYQAAWNREGIGMLAKESVPGAPLYTEKPGLDPTVLNSMDVVAAN
ncbi:MAG: FHA domain-containing protein [Thermoguttaceae bacterium]